MTSAGSDGLIGIAMGARPRKTTTTASEMARKFSLSENLTRRIAPNKSTITNICGRVKPASANAIHEPVRWPVSAVHMASNTKKMLTTCVWPHTDMLNHTAGLNKNRPAVTKLQVFVQLSRRPMRQMRTESASPNNTLKALMV